MCPINNTRVRRPSCCCLRCCFALCNSIGRQVDNSALPPLPLPLSSTTPHALHSLATSTVNPVYMKQDIDISLATWNFTEAEWTQLNELAVVPDDPVKSMCLLN